MKGLLYSPNKQSSIVSICCFFFSAKLITTRWIAEAPPVSVTRAKCAFQSHPKEEFWPAVKIDFVGSSRPSGLGMMMRLVKKDKLSFISFELQVDSNIQKTCSSYSCTIPEKNDNGYVYNYFPVII